MAVIHVQFESIHPFYDGNGRTGRIINMLYLVLKGLLDIPVLYMGRYIVRTKPDYYRLLQRVRTHNDVGALDHLLVRRNRINVQTNHFGYHGYSRPGDDAYKRYQTLQQELDEINSQWQKLQENTNPLK